MDILTDVALLSRIQFALTVAYHFIFVPLSIGLGLITAIFATKYYRSRDEKDGAAVTDDCSAVERLGMNIRLVEGEERNLKVTTPLDLKIAEMLLEEEQ